MTDELATLEATTADSVVVDLSQESGAPIARISLDPGLTLGDLADQAEAFGLAPGERKALYPVGAMTEELPPQDTRLGNMPVGEDGVLRLAFADSFEGAR